MGRHFVQTGFNIGATCAVLNSSGIFPESIDFDQRMNNGSIKESFLNLGFSACYTRERDVSANILDSSLAQLNIDNIERVKKNSFRIILNENYVSYSKALIKLDMDSLSDIRQQFC